MTEREAWLRIATKFDLLTTPEGRRAESDEGIDYDLMLLYCGDEIDATTYSQMLEKLDKQPDDWTTMESLHWTPEHSAKRAELCWKFAEECR